MLLKSRISNIPLGSEEWKQARLSRLTSSNWHKLMGEKGLGDTGMAYIRSRVFESLSGVPAEQDILNEGVAHGLVYERKAAEEVKRIKGFEFVATQVFIYGADPKESTTPDGLVIRKESSDELYYEVSTIETKAFQVDRHMKCVECESPQDIKKEDPKTYWQVLHQLHVVDALNGYLAYYHPDLPLDKGGIRIIEFRKMQQLEKNGKQYYPIVEDLKFLLERKALAIQEFERIRTKLLNIKN